MDGGTTGQWSDDVRRAFIATRLAEATSSSDPPQCCGEWAREFARSAVVKVSTQYKSTLVGSAMRSRVSSVTQIPQSEPPRRKPHWFAEWAGAASPPLRAESISFTHVINAFRGGQDPEHKHAQATTLKSIQHAAALANSLGVRVDVICVMYPEDVAFVPQCGSSGFRVVTLNLSAHDLLPQFRHPVRLPFVNQILHAGWLHGTGKYLTFSNIDIGVQAPFYLKV